MVDDAVFVVYIYLKKKLKSKFQSIIISNPPATLAGKTNQIIIHVGLIFMCKTL